MSTPRMTWTQEMDNQLRELAAAGHTTTKIAMIMGPTYSIPSVMMRAKRLRISLRRVKKHEASAWAGARAIPLVQLGNKECAFIVSADGAPALYCGQPASGKYPWCEHHHGIVYKPLPKSGHDDLLKVQSIAQL